MMLAIDYDGTLSLFNDESMACLVSLVQALLTQGIRSQIVTYRSVDRADGNDDVESAAQRLGIEVTYTDGQPKADFVSGHVMWLDDNPAMILFDKSILTSVVM